MITNAVVTLIDCPPGLFLFKGTLCFKSEYHTGSKCDAYVVSSGEYFWGGVGTSEERAVLPVTPVNSGPIEGALALELELLIEGRN